MSARKPQGASKKPPKTESKPSTMQPTSENISEKSTPKLSRLLSSPSSDELPKISLTESSPLKKLASIVKSKSSPSLNSSNSVTESRKPTSSSSGPKTTPTAKLKPSSARKPSSATKTSAKPSLASKPSVKQSSASKTSVKPSSASKTSIKPTSASKTSAKKPFVRTPLFDRKPNMNASVMLSNSRYNISKNLNSTVISHAPIIVSSNDDEMECTLAYCEYLNNLVKGILIREAIDEKRAICGRQLDAMREILNKTTFEIDDIQCQIDDIETHRKINSRLDELTRNVSESESVLDDSTVEQFNELNGMIETATDKLLLQNVDELKGPEEFRRFEELLSGCSVMLEKIMSIVGDVEGTQRLADCFRRIEDLYRECVNKHKSVEILKQTAVASTLENVSARLANIK